MTDHRKYVLWRILAPYVINVRKLSFDDALTLIKSWLTQCSVINRLDFNNEQRIKENLKTALRIGYFPIAFEKLKEDNKELHTLLSEEMHKHPKN